MLTILLGLAFFIPSEEASAQLTTGCEGITVIYRSLAPMPPTPPPPMPITIHFADGGFGGWDFTMPLPSNPGGTEARTIIPYGTRVNSRFSLINFASDVENNGAPNNQRWFNNGLVSFGSNGQVICATVTVLDDPWPCQTVIIQEVPCMSGCEYTVIEVKGNGPQSFTFDYVKTKSDGTTSPGSFTTPGVGSINTQFYGKIGDISFPGAPLGGPYTEQNTPAIANIWDANGNKFCVRVTYGYDLVDPSCRKITFEYVPCDNVQDPADACCANIEVRLVWMLPEDGGNNCWYSVEVRQLGESECTFGDLDVKAGDAAVTILADTFLGGSLTSTWQPAARISVAVSGGQIIDHDVIVEIKDANGRVLCSKVASAVCTPW